MRMERKQKIHFSKYEAKQRESIDNAFQSESPVQIEAEVCIDHVHMLLEIAPKYSVSSIMGYLKGKSSLYDIRKMGRYEIQIPKQRILV